MKILIRFFLILLVASTVIGMNTSCSEDNDCSMAGRAMVYCTLYSIDPETDIQRNDTLDSLTVTALGTDSIILNNEKKVHTLMFPLQYVSDSTVLVFHYDYKRKPTYTDTLYITQKNVPYFQSMECGYSMKQTLLTAHMTNGKFKGEIKMDTVKIINYNANTTKIQNLQIFYRFRDRTVN